MAYKYVQIQKGKASIMTNINRYLNLLSGSRFKWRGGREGNNSYKYKC